jgi:diacylglycerol O-acyltransferase
MVRHALRSRVRRTFGILPLLGNTVKTATTLVSRHRDPDAVVGAVPLTAPPTPWNLPITPHRRMSFTRVKLEDVKTIKNAVGCTVNDVVLGLMGGTLRRYLEAHDAFPADTPLIACCPVSVRSDEERGEMNNKVSAMFTSLATDVDDPIERLRTIHQVTKGAKEDHNALGANLLQDWAEHAAPTTFALAARLYSSMNLASHRPIHNVVISNVPGPPFPLYYAGAQLQYTLPMGPVMEGAGLNITVLSYMDNVDIGFMACRELIPDVWTLADYVQESMDELLTAASKLD